MSKRATFLPFYRFPILIDRLTAMHHCFCDVPTRCFPRQHTLQMRRLFYLLMLALRSPETKKRGGIAICSYLCHDEIAGKKASGFDGAWKSPKLVLGIPLHVAAVHMGFNSMKWAPVHAILKIALSVFTRIRFRAHYGKAIDKPVELVESFLFNAASYGMASQSTCFRERNGLAR